MAIMTLSGFLEQRGHETDVIIIEGEPDYAERVRDQIKPDIIGFSATTVDIEKLVDINRHLKSTYKQFFSIFGGSHPTFFPELIEKEPLIDAICIGEGEHALGELAERLHKDADGVCHIRNLHVRKNGGIVRNELRPLIDDLDTIPFLNKNIYSRYYANPYLIENVPIRFLASRGCPYQCTYCFNHRFFELYGVNAKKIRKRSVDSLLEEIKQVREQFPIPMISFVDDIFCTPMEWVREFSEKYRSEIGLPYSINTRPNTITEETAHLLKDSNCYYLTFSIESGDEYIRNTVLKRKMTERHILGASELLHKYGINFCTGNILGVPDETMETLKKTVRINQRCAPHYAWASLFQPFPDLELTKYAVKKGLFDGDFSSIGNDQFTDSPLKMADKEKIVRFHKFFALLVKYPYLYPVVNLLIRLPLNGLYNRLFKKYKIRFNYPVITASREALTKQYREGLCQVMLFYMKDLFFDLISSLQKGKTKR